MMKCLAAVCLVVATLCPGVRGYLGDDMAKTIQLCCSDGQQFARAHTLADCQRELPASADVPPALSSMCTLAKAQCCREYFQKKDACDSGVKDALDSHSCNSTAAASQACCSECAHGSSLGAAQGPAACQRTTGSSAEEMLARDAFLDCCQKASRDWHEHTSQGSSNTITLSVLPSTCEDYAPTELCAHHCIPVPGSYRCECNPGFMLMADGRNCKEVSKNRCKPRNHCQHKCNDNGVEVKCSCRRGYELMPDGKSCQDIDECQLDVPVCLAGTRCHNIQGSYRCLPGKKPSEVEKGQCPLGFTKNHKNNGCDDVNECLLPSPPCPAYLCENTMGGYRCAGVSGSPAGSSSHPEEDRCPPGFQIGHNEECEDVDECVTQKHDCNPLSQFCVNTHSSFYCQDRGSRHCPPGFKINIDTNKCEDINECEDDGNICRADQTCVNQLGQYDCVSRLEHSRKIAACPDGMRKREGSLYCEDIDECAEGIHMCELNQHCLNTNGSYDCHCKLGYELDITTSACVDVNECAMGQHECLPQLQRCDNTVGSYLCVRIASCGTGYVLQHSTGKCEDVDECALGVHNCGAEYSCFNMRGSFRCVRRRSATSSTTTPAPEYEYEYYDSDEEIDNKTSTSNESPKEPSTTTTSTTQRPEPSTVKQTTEVSRVPEPDRPENNNVDPSPSPDIHYSEPTNPDTSPTLLVIPKPPELPPKPEVPSPKPETPPPQPTQQAPTPTEPYNPTEASEPEVKPTEWSPFRPRQTEQEPSETNIQPSPKPAIIPPDIPEEELPKELQPTLPSFYNPEENESVPSRQPDPTSTPISAGTPTPPPPFVVNVNVGKETATFAGETKEDGSVIIDTKDIPKNEWTKISTKPRDCPLGFEPDEYGSCFDTDECVTNQHSCSGLTEECKNTIGGYTCTCAPGFRRDLITKACDVITTSSSTTSTTTLPPPPPLSSTSKSLFWGYPEYRVTTRPFRPRNLCDAGFHYNPTTYKCEDIDECTNGQANCAEVEICTNTQGGYKCECPPHWRLDEARHRCLPAQHHGRHLPPGYGNEAVYPTLPSNVHVVDDTDVKYDPEITQVEDRGSVFRCPAGYRLGEDNTCVDINECQSGAARCGPLQQCRNLAGGYACSCAPGHRLVRDHECEDVDECAAPGNLPVCSQNAQCVNTVGSYQCQCHAGFRSAPVNDKVCVDVDECSSSPAGSLCQQRCNNVWGGYRCSCHRGYRLNVDNSTCSDIDECQEFRSKLPCVGRCLNEPGSYRCACPSGYKLSEDARSCIDIDECETGEAPCAKSSFSMTSHDACVNTRGSFRCHRITCPQGYRLENKHRCTKEERVCQPGDWNCTRQPTTISYNFITFVSNLYIPDAELKLFTMKGPAWSNAKMRFELRLVNVNAPPSVRKKADISDFLLTQKTNFEGLMSLVRPLEGPQSIELEMSMDVYTDEHFGGTAIAKLFIYVSEYEF